MKKHIFVFCFLLNISFLYCQSVEDVFKPGTDILFIGIDYSKVKLIYNVSKYSTWENINPETIRDEYIPGWNSRVLKNQKKYNIAAAFQKTNFHYDFSPVEGINPTLSTEKLFFKSAYSIFPDTLDNMLHTYRINKKGGIALVFIMETLDKYKEKATMMVVFFDIATHKIIFNERISGRAKGLNFKSRWLYPVYDVIKTIQRYKYIYWKNMLLPN